MEVLKSLPLYFLVVALATFSSTIFAQSGDSISAEETQFQTVEWVDLIPPEVLEILLNPPAYISEIEDGSPEDQITSQISNATLEEEEDVYQRALASTDVNTELDGQSVRIPGFVVPLEFDEAQTISQFFLVPYFGGGICRLGEKRLGGRFLGPRQAAHQQ